MDPLNQHRQVAPHRLFPLPLHGVWGGRACPPRRAFVVAVAVTPISVTIVVAVAVTPISVTITIAAVAIVLTVPPVAVACEGSGQHPLGAERRLGGRGSVIDTRWFTVAVAVAVIPSVAAITVTVAVAVAAVVPLSVLLAPSLAPLLLLLLHALVE